MGNSSNSAKTEPLSTWALWKWRFGKNVFPAKGLVESKGITGGIQEGSPDHQIRFAQTWDCSSCISSWFFFSSSSFLVASQPGGGCHDCLGSRKECDNSVTPHWWDVVPSLCWGPEFLGLSKEVESGLSDNRVAWAAILRPLLWPFLLWVVAWGADHYETCCFTKLVISLAFPWHLASRHWQEARVQEERSGVCTLSSLFPAQAPALR